MSWLVTALSAVAISTASTPLAPGWTETEDERAGRLHDIARAIAYEARDELEAAIMLATAIEESGLAKDVDEGPCYRGKSGTSSKCDYGRSACVMQVHIGNLRTAEGWTKVDLFGDRRKCMAVAARAIRWSMSFCPKGEELSAYMSGRCGVEREASKRRMRHAYRILVTLRAWKHDAGL